MSDDQQKAIHEDSAPHQSKTTTEWIRDEEGVYETYANFFFLNWTPLDVRIRFAQLIPDPRQTQAAAPSVANERAAITMSWGHARVLRNLLSDVLERYENLNGELVVPKMPPSGPVD